MTLDIGMPFGLALFAQAFDWRFIAEGTPLMIALICLLGATLNTQGE